MTIAKWFGWGVMLFLAAGISLVSARYLTGNPEVFFPEQKLVYMTHTFGIISHVAGAMVALLLGPFQFLPRLRRKKWLNIHRWLGRVYLVGVLIGGVSGFYMATLAFGGLIARMGFGALAAVWLFTAGMAYWTIRHKNVKAHQAWMIRNYALTFAAVTLRLYLPFLAMGLGFEAGYQTVAWICWVPNLIVAQMIINRTVYRSRSSQGKVAGGVVS